MIFDRRYSQLTSRDYNSMLNAIGYINLKNTVYYDSSEHMFITRDTIEPDDLLPWSTEKTGYTVYKQFKNTISSKLEYMPIVTYTEDRGKYYLFGQQLYKVHDFDSLIDCINHMF